MRGLEYFLQTFDEVVNPFTTAAAAWDLEDLGLGATNCIRVRRDTDNLEQDFTFTEITDGTLLAFCGAGSGFVTIWYNQKGVFNAIQPSLEKQPRIVSNGILETRLGKPAIYFTKTTQYELFVDDATKLTAENGIESYVVFSLNTTTSNNSGIFGKWGGTLSEYAFLSNLSGGLFATSKNNSNTQINSTSAFPIASETALLEAYFNNLFQGINYNGANKINTAITSVQVSTNKFSIGAYHDNVTYLSSTDSYYQSLILFQSQNTGLQTEIRENINSRYNIY